MNSLIYWFTIGIVAGAPIALIGNYVMIALRRRRIREIQTELDKHRPPMP